MQAEQLGRSFLQLTRLLASNVAASDTASCQQTGAERHPFAPPSTFLRAQYGSDRMRSFKVAIDIASVVYQLFAP